MSIVEDTEWTRFCPQTDILEKIQMYCDENRWRFFCLLRIIQERGVSQLGVPQGQGDSSAPSTTDPLICGFWTDGHQYTPFQLRWSRGYNNSFCHYSGMGVGCDEKTENILQGGTPRKFIKQIDPFGAVWCTLFNYKMVIGDPKKRKSVRKLKTLMPALLLRTVFSNIASWRHHKWPVMTQKCQVLILWHIHRLFLYAQICVKSIFTSE